MDINELKNSMKKSVEHLDQEFNTLQIGRASTGLVEKIEVFIPEWKMSQPLNQLANIGILDAQTLKIEPWDKSNVKNIEKAIYDGKLGLTPQNMGEHIMIKIPPLTKERRQELTKLIHQMGEDGKISIRNNRHEAMKDIKGQLDDKEISEDEKKSLEKQIEDMTKEFNTRIDNKIKTKSEEIMTV